MSQRRPRYDVALSFAGEQRDYVEGVADALAEHDVEVFYDRYETAELWGRDLYEHLDKVYRQEARLCVLFVSREYREKVWPTHERRSAQARALRDDAYVLPVRFDDTEIPGLRETVSYLDARQLGPDELAEIILKKLWLTPQPLFVPPNPDRLWAALGATDPETREIVRVRLSDFVREAALLEPSEREAIFALMRSSCPLHLPAYVHVRLDKLRRILDVDRAELVSRLSDVSSMGFDIRFGRIRKEDADPEYSNDAQDPMLVTDVFVSWRDLSTTHFGEATPLVVEAVALAVDGLCPECGDAALTHLDFRQLDSETARTEVP